MLYKLKENRVYRTYLGGRHIDMFYGEKSCSDGFFQKIGLRRLYELLIPGVKILQRAKE